METVLFAGLSLQAWIVVAIVVLLFGLQLFTKLPADFVFLGGMAVLLLSGVVPAKQVLGGFSSESVVLIGVLFVVVGGLVHSGFLQWVIRYGLGHPKSYPLAIVRLMLPVAALSSFLNNTTVVALFTQVVKLWSKKLGVSPSKLLIPLSYASGMGGICTLIGTPPNLIISGFYTDKTGIALSIFTPTLVGLFCLFVGVLSVIAMRRLIPDRKSPEEVLKNTNAYNVEFIVPTDSSLVGKTVEEAGFTRIQGGVLVEIIRHDREIVSPVPADDFIFGGDRLIFSGQVEEILKLKETHQLAHAAHHVFSLDELEKNRKLQMVHVRFDSSLIGKCIADTDVETENNVVLVAIARQGEVVAGSPREALLKAGDTLLLECPARLNLAKSLQRDLQYADSDFLPVSGKRTLVSSLILIGMVLISSLGGMTLLQAAFLAAFVMIFARCCSIKQARESIDWSILMVFAGSICLGNAIQITGIAEQLSKGILAFCGESPFWALAAICLAATFITEFTSNTATAAIFFPITYQTAITLGANPLTFCVALMVAVSSSFATPIGSPTHMIVYGPGGYRFVDFIKIGLPMNLIILAANLLITLLLFPL